jgi:protein-arginine kinase activator protein McsA
MGLCLVLMILAVIGCESKKDENKDTAAESETSVTESRPQVEQAEKEPEPQTAQQKPEPDSTSTAIVCPDCGKGFKMSEDKKMMVCSGCGKTIDVNTFEQMRLKKILEAMKEMQNK